MIWLCLYSGYAMLKTVIVFLLIAIVISLATGFVFFYKDKGRSKRVMYALGVRVTLAIILMICVFYGLYSGQISFQTPWN